MAKGETKQNKPAAWVWILGAAVILLVLAGVFALPRLQQDQAGRWPTEVSVEQAHQLRDDGAFVLDVRQPDEWERDPHPWCDADPARPAADSR